MDKKTTDLRNVRRRWNSSAVIYRHPFTGKWVFALELEGGTLEGDELASRHGQFSSRKACTDAFDQYAKEQHLLSLVVDSEKEEETV